MRLLKLNSDGQISLTGDLIDDIPPYAILSHTWGLDNDEVTFNDLINRLGDNKKGYAKIQFCGEQARKNGLHHFWVDTCCIDKTSAPELQEAITSMFRWYRQADRCYVYLSDVSTDHKGTDRTERKWKSAFRRSRWFTRGWTIQELIAPDRVEFFSREGELLGSKNTLEQSIHEITQIPIEVLRGAPLSNFSVSERLRWAENRATKKQEDRAYCLMGIFDVFMPLIYGEGEHAFIRLKKEIENADDGLSVDHLPAAMQAPFDASNKQDDPLCLEDTRTEVLKRIRAWTYGGERSCIFWLNGMAGTGKSTIARTISREFSKRSDLGASFFFTRGGGDVGHAGMFFTSIAKQLAITRPSMKPFISEAIQHQPDIASKSRNDQWTKLIVQPLRKIQPTSQCPVLVIVVDALDECDNDNDMRGIIAALAQAQDVASVKLRIIVTSRPETPIRLGFKKMPQILHRDLLLHEQPREVVDADICLYFYSVFEEIKEIHGLSDDWPGVDIVNHLVRLSAGLFIFAATVCRFIQEYDRSAEDSLMLFLPGDNRNVDTACDDYDEVRGETTFFLDSMYIQILERSRPSTTYKVAQSSLQREILGGIAALTEPLPTSAFASLLSLRESEVHQRLNRLHSVIRVPVAANSPIRLFHASFRDFLFDQRRCYNLDFFVDRQEAHRRLLQSCIKAMKSALHRNMCDLQHPGVLVSEVPQSSISAYIPLYVQYACRNWLDHSDHGEVSLDDDGDVHHFLRKYCLYWLEVMSLIGKMPEAMATMIKLESMVDAKKAPELQSLASDTVRFMRTFSYVLPEAPLQLYSAGIFFSPSQSIIRQWFGVDASEDIEVITQIPDDWNTCIQTLEGHSSAVVIVVFSPDGLRVASGSWDKTVRVWDVQIGRCEHTLEGHSDRINSVVFSPNGSRVASGSGDKTVRVWDVQTGRCDYTLGGHSDSIKSVVFSPDGSRVISGSSDRTLRVWDMQTGRCERTLKGHLGSDRSFVFSPVGSLLASCSENMVQLLDVRTGHCDHTLKGHLKSVITVVAFSSNGSRLASGSSDKTVRVWDVQTGQCKYRLEGHLRMITSVAFSPDGFYVASSSDDNSVRVWNMQIGQCEHTLNSGYAEEVVFSPDGSHMASGFSDSIRVWDVQTGQCEYILKGHSNYVTSVVYSPDGSRIVSGSWDKTVRVWDLQLNQHQHTLEGHSESVRSLVFSPDGSRVASCSGDKTVRVWNAQTGRCDYTLEGHSNTIHGVVFSPDGSRVASSSWDKTVRVWDVQTGRCDYALEGHSDRINSVVFSPDGSRVASGSGDKTVRVWDVRTDQRKHTLEDRSVDVGKVQSSPDESRGAPDFRDETMRLWDVACSTELLCYDSGAVEQTIKFGDDGTEILINGNTVSIPSQTELHSTTADLPRTVSNPTARKLEVVDDWITASSERFLWLPPEYRPGEFHGFGGELKWACYGETIVIGSGTGRVTFIRSI